MICSRNINVQVFIGLCLLVATTLSLPLQEAQSDDHGINTRQVPDQCNNALIQQAIPHARSAVEKSNYIYDSLKSMFEEYLAPCFTNEDFNFLVILNTFEVPSFDSTHILSALEYDHSCSHIQNEINSTVSYLECATSYMGLILQNLTNDVIQLNHSDSISLRRKAVYDSYKNVSWITDIKNLTKVFPCDQSTSVQLPECISTYDSIKVKEFGPSCISNLLATDGAVYQKQTVVLAHVTELINRMNNKLEQYTEHCLT